MLIQNEHAELAQAFQFYYALSEPNQYRDDYILLLHRCNTNVFEFRKLLESHNVKLVLSGHGHVLEKIELGKTRYIQGGAVSGMWWKGPVHGNPEGFGVIECKPDGSFDFAYESFDWKVRA